MAKKKPSRYKPTKPLEVFVNAYGFFIAAKAISRAPQQDLLVSVVAVNEVFALELFLKCLHRLRRRNVTGHDIQALFDRLSADDRKRITAYYNDGVHELRGYVWAVSNGLDTDILAVLMRSRDLFIRLRYWHEGIPASHDAKGNVSNFGISALSASIKRLILELRPEWNVRENELFTLLKSTQRSK